jgi:hypothetical protein
MLKSEAISWVRDIPRRSASLGALAVLLSVVVILLPAPVALRLVATSALLFYLPGSAVILACQPAKSLLSAAALVWSVILSLALAVLGTLILNQVAPLSRTSWAILLGGLALVGYGVAGSRLRRHTEPSLGVTSGAKIDVRAATVRFRWVGLIVICSVALVAFSLDLAVRTTTTAANEQFAEVWLVPAQSAGKASSTLAVVGVKNDFGDSQRFNVTLAYSGRSGGSQSWRLDLRKRQVWTSTVRQIPGRSIEVELSSPDRPGTALASASMAASRTEG